MWARLTLFDTFLSPNSVIYENRITLSNLAVARVCVMNLGLCE